MSKQASRRPRTTRGVKPSNNEPASETQSVYKVEHGIQIASLRNYDAVNKFPFGIMNIGDSFLIPVSDPINKNPNTIHYAAKQYAKMKPGFAVTTRILVNKDRRVWRIK